MYRSGLSTLEVIQTCSWKLGVVLSSRVLKDYLYSKNIRLTELFPERFEIFKTNKLFTWSHNSAYMIGFFIGDGHQTKDRPRLYWLSTDKHIIYDFAKWLNYLKKPRFFPKEKDHYKDSYGVVWQDKSLCNHFSNILGIPQGKTYREGTYEVFNLVPDVYIGDFLRGLIDTDGSIYEIKKSNGIGAISFKANMPSLRNAYVRFLLKRCNVESSVSDVDVLVCSFEKVSKLLKLIYPGGKLNFSTQLHLKRKFDKACSLKRFDCNWDFLIAKRYKLIICLRDFVGNGLKDFIKLDTSKLDLANEISRRYSIDVSYSRLNSGLADYNLSFKKLKLLSEKEILNLLDSRRVA